MQNSGQIWDKLKKNGKNQERKKQKKIEEKKQKNIWGGSEITEKIGIKSE